MRIFPVKRKTTSFPRPAAERRLAIESLEARLVFAGDFDMSFGIDGRTDLHLDGLGRLSQTESAIQPDQKILITHSRGAMASEIVRLLPDGSLDEQFGDGGRVRVDFSPYEDSIHGLVLDGSNRILISGETNFREGNSFVARYTTDGELDTTFGEQGIVTFGAGMYVTGNRLRLLADGSIFAVASGQKNSESPETIGILIKLDADGNRDARFGESGNVALPNMFFVADLAVQRDGRIVFVGIDQEHNVSLIRYESDGTSDSSFGEDGLSTASFSDDEGERPTRIEIGPNGDIFVAGRFHWPDGFYKGGAAVARFDSDGKLDDSYGHDGLFHIRNLPYRGGQQHETDLIVSENGEVLLLGHVPDQPSQPNLGARVFRVSADGKASASVELGPNLFAGSLAQQADGELIVGGFDGNWETNGTIFTFVTRLRVDGPLVADDHPDPPEPSYTVGIFPARLVVPSPDDSGFDDRTPSGLTRSGADLTHPSQESESVPAIVLRDDHFAVQPNSGETTISVWLNDSFNGPFPFQEAPTITAIDADGDVGELRLANNGWQILYTPPRDFVGTKTFSYTVDDQYTANATIEVTEKLVGLRLVPVDSEGRPIVSVVGGSHFFLDVYASDLRPEATGIASAYVDAFLSDKLQPSPPQLGPEFSAEDGILTVIRNNQAATPHVFPGGIGLPSFAMVWNVTDVGGISSSSTGAGELLLARILLTAEQVQHDTRVELGTRRVDYFRNSAIRLNGRADTVPSGAILHDSVVLEIVTGWQNQEVPGDVNRDNHFTAQDILVLINSINLQGSRGLHFELLTDAGENRVTTFDSTTMERARYLYDINGDQFLSPTDVLMAINRINAQSSAEGESDNFFESFVIDHEDLDFEEDSFDSLLDDLLPIRPFLPVDF